MAATTDRKDEKDAMSDDDDRDEDRRDRDREDREESDDREERRAQTLAAKSSGGPGGLSFFTIYKRGQGYWTRMFTAGGAILIIGLTVNFIYTTVFVQLGVNNKSVKAGLTAAFAIVCGTLVWWLMNKPQNAEFLIATDSEMKKVNWTSRREIIGSTKVVIVFMFLIAGLLFVTDLFFSYFFYLIGVLKQWYFS